MKHTMSIRPLPDEVVAQIKSSTTIVSLTGVVLELLKNSLDAKASRIDVTVDFARGGCMVEDDGVGIAPPEFRADGGLGKLYCMYNYAPSGKLTNSHRDFEISIGRTSPRSAWHVSCLTFSNVSFEYHLTAPRIPLAQFDLVPSLSNHREADTHYRA